jgi:putative ABC transport system permease protein
LIVTETALALSLLVGAGLLVRSFVTLLNVDPGFAQENVAAFQVFAYQDGETNQDRLQFFEETLERIRNLPGVSSAGAVEAAPFLAADMSIRVNFTIDGKPAPAGEEPQSYVSAATPDYFATLDVPLVAGRLLNTFDRADGEAVTVINQTMRERFWPNEDPIGKYIRVVGSQTPIAIVGVVGAVLHGSLENDPRPEFFVPHTQRPTGSMTYFVRSSVDAAAIMGSVQEEIWRVQPLLSFYHAGTVDALIGNTLRSRRFSMVLLMSFAIIAVVMAAVGLYGVISYSVSQRTREVGIRMALGAGQTDVVALVVRDGVGAIAVGIVIGVIGSVAAARVIANQLFGITPHDTITYGGAALVLLLVGLVASYLPARRAAQVDPARTLREA